MPMQDVLNTSERTVIDLPLEVKAGGLPGEFEGYGAVFGNTDRDGDVVAKGAFVDSLKARLPALLWQHVGFDLLNWLRLAFFADMPEPPALNGTETLVTVLMAMLGLGGLRTVEKLKGVSRDGWKRK
jgi:hypothetical protein